MLFFHYIRQSYIIANNIFLELITSGWQQHFQPSGCGWGWLLLNASLRLWLRVAAAAGAWFFFQAAKLTKIRAVKICFCYFNFVRAVILSISARIAAKKQFLAMRLKVKAAEASDGWYFCGLLFLSASRLSLRLNGSCYKSSPAHFRLL